MKTAPRQLEPAFENLPQEPERSFMKSMPHGLQKAMAVLMTEGAIDKAAYGKYLPGIHRSHFSWVNRKKSTRRNRDCKV